MLDYISPALNSFTNKIAIKFVVHSISKKWHEFQLTSWPLPLDTLLRNSISLHIDRFLLG